ncbi:G-protein coupled receptor 39-like [Polyodon spathula]|uniref:G-protein coupled receptor 39-like n=1 Tax=Polyodon spathula TaxID=7913 RepID=UPI001B7DC7D9|nr:G-protein coupled receptor 39-like [Polyodon spathula]
MSNTSEEAPCWPTAEAAPRSTELSFRAKAAVTAVYGGLFLFGVLGNLLVLRVTWILKRGTRIQKSVCYHVASMACSDLLILSVGIPVELYSIIWCPYPWRMGDAGCKGFYFLWETCSYATVFNILAFSLERYLAACHPLRAKAMSRDRSKRLVVLVWLLSLVCGMPALFAMGVEDALSPFRNFGDTRLPVLVCTNIASQEGTFKALVYTSFVLYVGVLLSVGVTCQQMVRVLLQWHPDSVSVRCLDGSFQQLPKFGEAGRAGSRRQNVLMLGRWLGGDSIDFVNFLCTVFILFFVLLHNGYVFTPFLTRLLPPRTGCIVGLLAVCWVPFQSRRLMTVLRGKSHWTEGYYRSYITLQPAANAFYYLSSSVNPLLYNATSRQFRRVFSRLVRYDSFRLSSRFSSAVRRRDSPPPRGGLITPTSGATDPGKPEGRLVSKGESCTEV